MSISLRTPADRDEMHAFVDVHRRTYFMSPEDGGAWADWVVLDDFRIAELDGQPVGGMQLVPMGQVFGGRSVPMTGISAVGIEPQARAGGAGTGFMTEVLRELHGRGVALSSLYPATQTVYRRCGYELAGSHLRYRLDTDAVDPRDRELDISLTEDDTAIKAVYAERARRTGGNLDRSDRFWERIFEPYKQGKADRYLVTGPEGAEGYICYTRRSGDTIRFIMQADIAALTPRAVRRILTFIADHRSFTEAVVWNGAPADPFTFQLAEPRRQVTMSWPWMMRIVDVQRALAERGYPADLRTEISIALRDDVLADNDGDWTIAVSDGKASVARGGRPSVTIDVRGLACLYSGYASARELLATGYAEGSDTDLARLDAVFAAPAPWLPDFF